MSPSNSTDEPLHPDKAIRRFDVFAEYTRLERLDRDYPEDEAKGYGIWLAKVVAARKFSSKSAEARDKGEKYEDIRDSIRKDWKPEKRTAR